MLFTMGIWIMETGPWLILESTPVFAAAGRSRETREFFRRIQKALLKAGAKVPQNLLEPLSSFAKVPIAVPSAAITPNLQRL